MPSAASPVAVTPQVENRPSSVEELFGAMCEARMKKRVVGAAVDFHGDAARTDRTGPHGRAEHGDQGFRQHERRPA